VQRRGERGSLRVLGACWVRESGEGGDVKPEREVGRSAESVILCLGSR
jgi:hypothetical protein